MKDVHKNTAPEAREETHRVLPGRTFRVYTLIVMVMTIMILPTRPVSAEEMTLTEAANRALEANHRILSTSAQTSRAEAAVWEARSSLLPDVVAVGEYSRMEEPSLVQPMHGTPTPADPLTFDDEIYTGVLRLDVPILNLSALSGVRASRFGVDSGRARERETEQRVLAAVAEIYVQSGQIADNLTLMEGHIRALERRLEELRNLAAEGRVPSSSVAEVESTLQTLQADRLELEFRRDELSYRLASLLGTEEPVSPVVPVFSSPPALGTVTSGPAAAVAEARYLSALAARDGARYSFAPRISGYASQTARSGSEDLDFNSEWSLGLTVTVPLVTGGERIARLKAAEADLEAAAHNREAARKSELTESQRLARRWENAADRQELLARATSNQERAVAAVENRFREGRGSLSDLLSEETTLLELRMHQRSTRYDQLLSYIAYAELAGDLSPALMKTLIEE